MGASKTHVKVAVTQHEPVWLDLEGTVKKTIAITKEAAEGGAQIVAFPELWIPGYPAWIWSRPVDFDLGVKYVQNSLALDSPEMQRIRDAAAENNISISLGFSERAGDSVYIAQALIDNHGQIRMRRRKFKPTHMERTIFGDASGECLAEVQSLEGVGKVGALSCWEHIQPLLKQYTLSQGEEIHCAGWPPLDSFIEGSPGFYSMSVEGCLNLSQTYAMESQSFVLHATSALSTAATTALGTAGSPIMGHAITGSSAVVGPDGRVLARGGSEPEVLLWADLDMALVTKTRTFADAAGHYSRPDLLWLGADPSTKPVVRVKTAAAE